METVTHSQSGFVNENFEASEEDDSVITTTQVHFSDSKEDEVIEISVPVPKLVQPEVRKVPAVIVRNAKKSYKSKRGTSVILNDFNMTVMEGQIYSLLGSSGCGKTTLLSCCVGVKNLDEGEIRIFSKDPKNLNRQHIFGYMPQEIALYSELSIREILQYFGKMSGMSFSEIKKRQKFLIDLLALPPSHRRISSLSGGQQRRVSFSIALLHSPKLLILDEPTVGVDPLLRQSIWNHLVQLVSTGKTTVLITTHYSEEARQSNMIGLMRGGRLLAEDSPESLLERYNTAHLETIVLKLCLQDSSEEEEEAKSTTSSTSDSIIEIPPTKALTPNDTIKETDSSHKRVSLYNKIISSTTANNSHNFTLTKDASNNNLFGYEESGVVDVSNNIVKLKGLKHRHPSLEHVVESNLTQFQKQKQQNEFIMSYNDCDSLRESNRFVESIQRINAMAVKNAVSLLRNFLFLLFLIFMPAIQVIIVCIAVGQDPKGLPFGLINHDVSDPRVCVFGPGCVASDNYTGSISCLFLDILGRHGTFNMKYYDNEDDAARDVELSKSWGYILFYENYTTSMKDRALFGMQAEPEAIYGSRIKFRLDQSNLQIFREVSKVFLDSFTTFLKTVSTNCDLDPIYSELPIYFAQPIFGEDSITFTDFLAPSVLLAVLFFFPLSGSGIAYIGEKKSGTLSRSLVAGVNHFEIMMSHLVVQLTTLIVQVVLSFVILSLVFKIHIAGPAFCAFLLAVLVGVAGMSMGFLVAAFCDEEIEAVFIALAAFVPNMLLSGLLWPLEGMPLYLQYFSCMLPCTWAAEAMRSVLTRGVGYFHPSVWPGFVSIVSWIVLYWVLNLLVHKLSSRK